MLPGVCALFAVDEENLAVEEEATIFVRGFEEGGIGDGLIGAEELREGRGGFGLCVAQENVATAGTVIWLEDDWISESRESGVYLGFETGRNRGGVVGKIFIVEEMVGDSRNSGMI